MTLKELYEGCTAEEIKEIIFDHITKPLEYQSKYNFEDYLDELVKCEQCDEINERDKMIDTEQIVNGGVGLICEECYRSIYDN